MFLNCVKNTPTMESSIGFGFLKNYHKNINVNCKDMKKTFNVEPFYLLKLSM